MLNYRGGDDPKRTVVTAAAARTSGELVIEEEIAGVAVTNAASGAKYALAHSQGEFEFPFVANTLKGYSAFINTGTFAITTQAKGGATPGSTRFLGTVTAVPGDGPNGPDIGYTPTEPLPGFMWIELAPQAS